MLLFMLALKLQLLRQKKNEHELIWLRKLLRKITYQNSSVYSITKVKYKHEVLFKSSVHDIDAFVFPVLVLVTLTQRSPSGKGIAR
jgi:hypothetical protein